MGKPSPRVPRDTFDDLDEAVTEAALMAFETMRSRGHSDAAAWDVADRIVAGFLSKLEEDARG